MPEAEDGAPAAPENVALSFVDGSLDGVLTFDMPAVTFDGNAAEGEVDYSVSLGGEVLASGSAAYGQKGVSAALSVPASGKYEFVVSLENAVGKSPDVKTTAYIGYGRPAAPGGIGLVYDGGRMVLGWEAVTTVEGEGYLGDISYTVVRHDAVGGSADLVVAENISATHFEEEYAEPSEGLASVYYTVTAHNGDMDSKEAASPAIALGSVVPPYVNTFDDNLSLAGFTILDCNNDNKIWQVKSGKATMDYSKSADMDDWLISPPLMLEAGAEYRVSVDVSTLNSVYVERFEIRWGDRPTVEGLETEAVPLTETATKTPQNYSFVIRPETAGKYYVGIHGCSDKDLSYIYVDNLSVELSGVSGIGSLQADAAVIVSVTGGISVSGAAGLDVAVASLDGKLLYSGIGDCNIPLSGGVYLVSVGGKVSKVIVR